MGSFHSKFKHKQKEKGSKKDSKKTNKDAEPSSVEIEDESKQVNENEKETSLSTSKSELEPIKSDPISQDEELPQEVSQIKESKQESPDLACSVKKEEVSETLQFVEEKENEIVKEKMEISKVAETVSVCKLSEKSELDTSEVFEECQMPKTDKMHSSEIDSNEVFEECQIPKSEIKEQSEHNDKTLEERTISNIETTEITNQVPGEACPALKVEATQQGSEKDSSTESMNVQNENLEKESCEVEKLKESTTLENVGDALDKESNESKKDLNSQANDEGEDKIVKPELHNFVTSKMGL